ncbi:hypothetical protein HY468_01300 [Candidatus Roizmanbacteria bacterium]|nr:hypothetical protein [Candidatus Roizmanbacteria bacterium]
MMYPEKLNVVESPYKVGNTTFQTSDEEFNRDQAEKQLAWERKWLERRLEIHEKRAKTDLNYTEHISIREQLNGLKIDYIPPEPEK